MKTCYCTCGCEIDLDVAKIEVVHKEKGYKYSYNEYYTVCPLCGERQVVQFHKLPFKRMWELYKKCAD